MQCGWPQDFRPPCQASKAEWCCLSRIFYRFFKPPNEWYINSLQNCSPEDKCLLAGTPGRLQFVICLALTLLIFFSQSDRSIITICIHNSLMNPVNNASKSKDKRGAAVAAQHRGHVRLLSSFPLSCFLSLPSPTPFCRIYKYSWQRWDGLPKAFRFQAKGFHSAALRPHNSLSCPLCHPDPKSHICCRPFNLRLYLPFLFLFSLAMFCFFAHRSIRQRREGKVYVSSMQAGRCNYQLHGLTKKDCARVALEQIACLLTNSVICGAQETHISRAKWMFLAKQQHQLIYLQLFAVVCWPPHPPLAFKEGCF